MRKITGIGLLLFLCIFVWGCTAPRVKKVVTPSVALVEIGDFCKKHNLKYRYLPFYEAIEISSDSISIKLKPDYSYALCNNSLRSLGSDVVYKNGRIFLPPTVASLLKGAKKKTLKDLVSLIDVKVETIVIDPGHGGRDPGAISPWGLKEKGVNLTIATYLRNLLKQRGFKVYLTRETDSFISLKGRVWFAKSKRADLFISIHSNANRSSRLRGFEVYYLSPKFSDTQSKVLATAENLCQNEGLRLSSGLKNIVGEMLNTENKRETTELVERVMNAADNLGIYTRKAIGAPFYVLKYNVCPAVLVEVGYLTNRSEEKLLRTSLYKKQLALAVAEGVSRLRDSLNRRLVAER